jgi:iron(III) transport system substrate-binding protein
MTDDTTIPTDRRTDTTTSRLSRRKVLATTGLAGTTALAGCGGFLGGGGDNPSADGAGLAQFRGSGPLVESRGELGGTRIADLPDLSGELNLYIGGGEGGLYIELLDLFKRIYDDFSYNQNMDASASLANTIVTEVEQGSSRADMFISVDAGSLASVAQEDAAESLPSEVTDMPDGDFATDSWVGVAGRARAIPYNSNRFSASDIPDSVRDFPEVAAFQNDLGWAPSYSAFQSFVTAMRLLRGEEATRQWLVDLREMGTLTFDNEFLVSTSVADGELAAGFANHYYALRVRNSRQNAPLDLAFTSGDAGALINVSGGLVIRGTERQDLANLLLRHLLSAEAQEFFATRTFAYPTVPEVPPAGGLPSIDELNPPDIDLTELSDQDATLDLLRETNVL